MNRRALLALVAGLGLLACTPADTGDTADTSPTDTEDTGDDTEDTGDDTEDTGDDTDDTGDDTDDTGDDTGLEPVWEQTTVFFARESGGGWWWVEPEEISVDVAGSDLLHATFQAVLHGTAHHPSLESIAPAGTTLLGVQLNGDILQVDLSSEVMGLTEAKKEEAFAQQLAYTAVTVAGATHAVLRIDGSPVSAAWVSVDWTAPIEPDIFKLTPVTIETPRWGDTHAAGAFTFGGKGLTWENTVLVRLLDPSGTEVEDGVATVGTSILERFSWTHTFTAPADTPGTWAAEAYEDDPSGGEGRPVVVTRVEFEVVE